MTFYDSVLQPDSNVGQSVGDMLLGVSLPRIFNRYVMIHRTNKDSEDWF